MVLLGRLGLGLGIRVRYRVRLVFSKDVKTGFFTQPVIGL